MMFYFSPFQSSLALLHFISIPAEFASPPICTNKRINCSLQFHSSCFSCFFDIFHFPFCCFVGALSKGISASSNFSDNSPCIERSFRLVWLFIKKVFGWRVLKGAGGSGKCTVLAVECIKVFQQTHTLTSKCTPCIEMRILSALCGWRGEGKPKENRGKTLHKEIKYWELIKYMFMALIYSQNIYF